jgi:hypothetical protein
MNSSRHTVNDWLILGTRAAAGWKTAFSFFEGHAFVNHLNQIFYLPGKSGFGVPCENKSPSLFLANKNSGLFKLVELLLNREKGHIHKIGFMPTKSRYSKHPECAHLCLEFPRGPVEIGEDYPMIPAEVSVEGRTLRLLSPTDCIKDRLASFIHWKSRDSYNQALLVGRNQRGKIDMREIARWCEGEGVPDVYQKFALELSEIP